MAHRRIKDVSYDEDDYDDYEEEEYDAPTAPQASTEDQMKMRQGTDAVREALGQDSDTTTKEIEEALWYYYYDVDKTVAYLTKQNKPQEPKAQKQKQKPQSKFDLAAGAAQSKAVATGTGLNFLSTYPQPSVAPFLRPAPFSAADFFADTPWLSVPPERLGNITIEPLHARGGLLGGSSTGVKPQSKLAALAAARKKAAEEKKRAAEGGQDGTGEAAVGESVLDRLSALKVHGANTAAGIAQPATSSTRALPIRSYPKRQKIEEPEPEPVSAPSEAAITEPAQPEKPRGPTAEELTAPPSIFARTMLGSPNEGSVPAATSEDVSLFSLSYQHDPKQTNDPFAGPSPDDVVIKAQSKGSQNKKTSAVGKKSVKDVTQEVDALRIDVEPHHQEPAVKTKSKNLNVLEEFNKSNAKNAASFVVIGHVDHGKSTLMGRLLYDLKLVHQRTYDKLAKEATATGKSSFAFAWVMDSTAEERARGVTVDIATNTFETSLTRFTILDAPGHRDFIPNMIAGASQADFAVLVIDASTNAFESGLRGQTKEHALLARSLGISRVIVAINKMDSANWSQSRFEEVKTQMQAFLVAAGFKPDALAFIPVAGLTGENVATALPPATAPWYTGGTLVSALDTSAPPDRARAITSPLRLTIADVFRGGITNPLSISGRLDAGNTQIGDVVLAMPSGLYATVRGIEVDSEPAEYAVAGQIATVHLADIDASALRPGDVLCAVAEPVKNVRAFVARILAFETLMPGSVDCHRGRLHVPARVSELVAGLTREGVEIKGKRPRVVKAGGLARVRVEIEGRGAPLEKGNRVVLRSGGVTVAAGLVEGVVV